MAPLRRFLRHDHLPQVDYAQDGKKPPPLQQQYWFPGPPNGFWFWMNGGISPKLIFHLVLGGVKLPPCPKKSTTFEALFAITVNTLINLIIYLHHQPKSNKHVCQLFPSKPRKNRLPVWVWWFFHQFPTARPIFRTKKKKTAKGRFWADVWGRKLFEGKGSWGFRPHTVGGLWGNWGVGG